MDTLSDYNDGINSASFSPDGTGIVTVSRGQNVKIRDLTGKVLVSHRFRGVVSTNFSSDGSRVIATSINGEGRIYYANFRTILEELKTELFHVWELTDEQKEKYGIN